MSIVEKVIDQENRTRGKRKSIGSSAVQGADTAASVDDITSGLVDVHSLNERGLTTVLENTDLSKPFRFLKRAVLAKIFGTARSDARSGKSVMVTSAMPGAGKSFMAFNLAASIAQEQMVNVVLIDSDIVRHNLTTALELDDRDGLMEMLRGSVDRCILETSLPGLRFIPAGQYCENATELLASDEMAGLAESLNDPDTIVIIDSTPLLVASEAGAVAAHADHVIIVVEAGNTSVDEIGTMLQMLEKFGSTVNFIMNKLKTQNQGGGKSHYYYPY